MATSLNWNINSDSDKEEHDGGGGSCKGKGTGAYQSPPTSPLFHHPLHSFSSFGGGDAPLGSGGGGGVGGGLGIGGGGSPGGILRSQLFTISTTRAVMTTSVNYSPSPPSSSVDSDIEDFKPLNTQSPPNHNHHHHRPHLKIPGRKVKVVKKDNPGDRLHLLTRSRRCIHGSFEDLLKKMEKEGGKGMKRRGGDDPRGEVTRERNMVECCNGLLVEENRQLKGEIGRWRRKVVMGRVAGVFLVGALRRKGRRVEEMKEEVMGKMRECAARLILHSLLLNCWRNTRRELEGKLVDNGELRKGVENLALQVQVLRHVQAGERQRGKEREKVIEEMEVEGKGLREENEGMRKEVERMEGELNWLEGRRVEVEEENGGLREEVRRLEERRDGLVKSLEWERGRAGEVERENKGYKENLRGLEEQLREATEQRTHWQERARCSESEAWELQLHLEGKAGEVKGLKEEIEMLRKERKDLIGVKGELKGELDGRMKEVEGLRERNEVLVRLVERVKEERDGRVEEVNKLEERVEGMRREWREVEKELMGYKLENVRRRRSWGNALYFVVSPMDAVKRKLM